MPFALNQDMRFSYKDLRGKVVILDGVTQLAQAVRDGLINPETLLALGEEEQFRKAENVVAYQQVVVGLERNLLGTTPSAKPRRPAPKAPSRRVAFGLVAVAAVALVVFLARSPAANSSALSATATPSREMRAALERLVTEFGDSVARRQHRLEKWLAELLDHGVRTRDLQSPAALRAVRVATADFVKRVDTLQLSASVLASRLVLRADSLEGTDGAREGLFVAAGDALRRWEQDLATYADVQRATAATLDSLAEFTLTHQQSFVVRDGHPVFLSRSDAARFHQLVSGLDDLASKEQRWAEGVLARNPGWMTALAPADRPAFRRTSTQRSNQ
jgi:hypothetical protein